MSHAVAQNLVYQGAISDWFFLELQTDVPAKSFIAGNSSQDFIRALEDCELFYITGDELKQLYRTFIEFNVVGRLLVEKCRCVWHRQGQNVRILTREELYGFLSRI
jgi:hypothetical protein